MILKVVYLRCIFNDSLAVSVNLVILSNYLDDVDFAKCIHLNQKI